MLGDTAAAFLDRVRFVESIGSIALDTHCIVYRRPVIQCYFQLLCTMLQNTLLEQV